MLLQYGPHFFSTLSEKFGQLAGFFWANGLLPPPGKKFPVRLCCQLSVKFISKEMTNDWILGE